MSANKAGHEALLAKMREGYLRDLPEKINELESLALQIPKETNDESFEALYRATHSMKGSAGTFGYGIITNICHNLEDRFYDFKESRSSSAANELPTWLNYIDLLRDCYQLLEGNVTDFADIESRLAQLRQREVAYDYRGLVVAESALDIGVVQQAFSEYPIIFSTLNDGLQAVERLLAERFDFYVLTNQLPRLNGPSIITAIRSNRGYNRRTPCILLSGSKLDLPGRDTDPEFVVTRNNQFLPKLQQAAEALIHQLQG
ncbi:MAG: Hpt domain-containing protein [Gammaproteobacteria bacterium]|nr:Hpt domain-containing protein [Gammaproteobacteria bacterium]